MSCVCPSILSVIHLIQSPTVNLEFTGVFFCLFVSLFAC